MITTDAIARSSGPPPAGSSAAPVAHESTDRRILIAAPTANDARLTGDFLSHAGLAISLCGDMPDLCRKIAAGCGALLLAEEVLTPASVEILVQTLSAQPSWSDIPITLVSSKTPGHPLASHHLRSFGPAATISLLERPFRAETLVSMLEAGLRSRERQYQVRDLFDELRASESRVRRIFEQTVVGIAEMDFSARFTLVNDRYCAIAGRERSELLALSLTEIVHPDDVTETQRRLAALVAGTASSFIIEKRLARPDGTVAWVHDHLSVVRDGDGRPCGITLASDDITLLKRNQHQLAQARDEAVAASRAKDDFLAALSHELRTPLNPVLLLASEGASNPSLPPGVQSDFETIARNIALEARLIDDLLDLTRITRGKLQIQRQPHSLHVILEDAIATVHADFAEKRMQLKRKLAPTQLDITGDAVRLQQVFWNILKNAVKFTPAGGVIGVETKLTADRSRAIVSITDTGIGMNEAEIARIFEAFVQGDHAAGLPHRFGGLGLGLAISKRLVELHDGAIAATSEGVNRGSTFTVELPLAAKPAGGASAVFGPEILNTPISRLADAQHILLVDDHEPSRTALMYLLQRRHFRVTPAGSIAEALRAAGRGDIELVVSDIGLPDGTGYELMRKLSDTYGLRGIAVTGYGTEQDVALSERAGFVAHLTKPVRIEALDRALKTMLAAG